MKMLEKQKMIFFVFVFVLGKTMALMDTSEFSEIIYPNCFENGIPKPHGAISVENFIYLLEKFERSNSWSHKEIIETFLEKFSFDGGIYEQHIGRELYAINRRKLIEEFVGHPTVKQFSDDIFNATEKCTLHFMLSRRVAESKETDRITPQPTVETTVNNVITEMTDSIQYVEEGVAGLNADKNRAVALGEVLYGIYGALVNKKIHVTVNEKDQDKQENAMSSQYVFSLAEKVGYDYNDEELYETNGQWSSQWCTKKFILNRQTKVKTYANMLGAIDGFIMGTKLLEDTANSFRLSQLLRMYYSPEGFGSQQSGKISYCDRISIIKNIKNELANEVKLFFIKKYSTGEKYLTDPEEYASPYVDRFYNALERIASKTDVERENCQPSDKETYVCETPTDVIAVLDQREHFENQLETMAKVVNHLSLGFDEGTITAKVNSQADIANIKIIVAKSESKADSACDLIEYEKTNDVSADDDIVLNDIKGTLMKYQNVTRSLPGINSKTVIYYNFGKPNANRQTGRRINDAAMSLHKDYKETRIIAIGDNKDYLSSFATNPNYVMTANDPHIDKDLVKKICLVPAIFQYENCKEKSKQDDKYTYTGYVSPKHVQYWAMHPKYYLKSYSYKLIFKPENGNIRVCHVKNNPNPSVSGEGCKQTKPDNQVIEFTARNPCKGYSIYNCPVFNFAIFGLTDDDHTPCTDESGETHCKTLDKIKFTFKHEGLSCSSAIRNIASYFHIIFTLLIASYIIRRKS